LLISGCASSLGEALLINPKAILFCLYCYSSVRGTGATLPTDVDTAADATGWVETAVFPSRC